MSSTPNEPNGTGTSPDNTHVAQAPARDTLNDHTETGRPGRANRVATAVRRWQRELSELGGPNTLLWHKDSVESDLELTTAHPGGVSMLMAGRATRLSDLVRERSAFLQACRTVELIRGKAIELEEERGLRTCFMAIGMATWNVPGAQQRACAPVLIRSCTLHPVDPAHRDYDIDLGDDLDLNPVLVNYLASRGITIDPENIVDLAYTSQRFDPQPVFREIQRLGAELDDLKVIDRKVVSTFSPAKLPMIADLRDLGDTLVDHDVIAALAGDTQAGALLANDDVTDNHGDITAVRELLVLDADSHQENAINAVRAGVSLAITGAPGTGRTQTVANIVSGALAVGKRVLVVANKRTALVDLHKRLNQCELGGFVLDFPDGAHSPAEPSRAYVDSISTQTNDDEPDITDLTKRHEHYRARLAAHREHLHAPRTPWGVSIFDALSARTRLARRSIPPTSTVRLPAEVLNHMDRATCETAGATLKQAALAGAWTHGPQDPWAGARVTEQTQVDSLTTLVRDLAGKRFTNDTTRLDAIFADVGLPAATCPADWAEALAVLTSARRTMGIFSEDVYTADLDSLVDATADREQRERAGITLGWWARNSLTRRAKDLLRENQNSHIKLHDPLVSARDERTRWQTLGGRGGPRIPDALDEAIRLWNGLASDIARLEEVLAASREGADLLHQPVPQVGDRLTRLAEHTDRLTILPTVTPLLDELTRLGLQPLVDDLANRNVKPDDAVEELEHVWWESILETLGNEPTHEETIAEALAEYIRLDQQYIRTGGRRVAARATSRMKHAKVVYADQAAYLASQARQVSHHDRPRDLLTYTADALLAARPIWTMSPLVVGATVPPGQWFDLVIIEGAEQITTAESISAIARAGQVVLVGDTHGLPPAPFSLTASTPARGDMVATSQHAESVLSQLASVLPQHRLGWQYGCDDERIFGFANLHEYNEEFVTFASTRSDRPIDLVTISAPEEHPGDTSTAFSRDLTRLEVAEVVRLALEHARNTPELSLGIATVSAEHTVHILSELRHRLTDEPDPVVLAFFEAQEHSTAGPEGEPFYVKNLERVPGDMRDRMIFAIGTAAGQDGRALHRAGPLGLDGGERRINCVVAAARSRLTVVTSLTASDLDGGRMTSRGARALHDLIAYADSGGDREVLRRQVGGHASNVTPLRTIRRSDDAILGEFALQLRKEGLVVHERLGSSCAPLDLAVEDPYVPGRIVVAIESDGRRYADMTSTRERERLRGEQFDAMGWEYVRVWSEDLAEKPSADVARVIEAIRTADARAGRVAGRSARNRSTGTSSDLW
ncbi:DNA helicase [Dermatophilus congolensis]|uniref:DNA helicase n=1 Tax=Dermatophilus congolensis TaxID=1863 RepID=UPI001AAEA675|nr:DNA helicase [Dermatophilus congolensis]MBO3131450.1 DNA helicase [Dermatophilus congolensis]MBO3134394.1 DNA helicase [Dermatophilus congolensis]MBO3136629.1 DNA helicase [Dermatophilus congolensis]MBO3138873.1 DNA helicase [Dermatophilus congolensis]